MPGILKWGNLSPFVLPRHHVSTKTIISWNGDKPTLGDMSLHPEKMMGSGLTTSEVRQVSPILQGVLDEIRQVFLALSEEVLTMGGDF